MSKVEEFIAETKLNDLLHKKEAESQKNKVIWVLAIIGAVAAVAGIAYAVYRSLHRIIWKSLKMILTMTSMIISAKTIRCKKLFAKVKQNIQAECG